MEKKSEPASLVMMTFTLFSRLLGILKSRVMAVYFGSGALADAINFAFNLPNSLRKVFAEGSLSASYIPLFSQCQEDKEKTETLYRQMTSFLILIFLSLLVLSVFLSRPLVAFLSDFPQESQVSIAASLLPFFTVFLFFISFAILVSSILQVRRKFLASAVSPVFFSLAVIIAIPLLSERMKHYSMAAGVVAGSIAEAAVVYLSFRKYGIRFAFDFHFNNPVFRKMLSSWAPASISSLIAIISQNVSFFLASGLSEGSVTSVSNAIVFYSAPYGIFFASISAVYFPLMSGCKNEKKRAGVLSDSLVYLYTFLLPSAITLIALSRDCVSAVLQKGAFTVHNTVMTASVLDWYLVAMIPMAFYAMLQRYMYSRGLYRKNLLVSLTVSISDIFLTVVFINTGFDVISLPVSSVFSNIIGMLLLSFHVKDAQWKGLFSRLARISIVNIPLILLACVYKIWNPQYYLAGSTLFNFLRTAGMGLACVAFVLILYAVFRVDFFRQLRNQRR